MSNFSKALFCVVHFVCRDFSQSVAVILRSAVGSEIQGSCEMVLVQRHSVLTVAVASVQLTQGRSPPPQPWHNRNTLHRADMAELQDALQTQAEAAASMKEEFERRMRELEESAEERQQRAQSINEMQSIALVCWHWCRWATA